MIRGIATTAIAGVAFLALAGSASAAITVVGTGPSQACYQAAEYGTNPQDGIEACSAALMQIPLTTHDKAATLVNRGILHSRNGDTEQAMSDYNNGLAVDAGLGEAYVDRGAIEIVQRDFTAALDDINKGIDLNAHRLEIAYYDRAVVDEAMGNIKNAYLDYRKAVELRPDFTLANEQLQRFRVVKKHTNGA